MQKFIATKKKNCQFNKEWCASACQKCQDCKKESRAWNSCWSACDECNKCAAKDIRTDVYNDPYNYMPLYPRKLSETPLSKQFCDNICGVNMCKRFRQRQNGYAQCKRCHAKGLCWSEYKGRCVDCLQNKTSCEKKWGCPNQQSPEFGYVAPIDPMFTECRPCWK